MNIFLNNIFKLLGAYERRIADLEIQTDQHQREIAQWYSINLNPESSEAAQWLSGVMDYYK